MCLRLNKIIIFLALGKAKRGKERRNRKRKAEEKGKGRRGMERQNRKG
jgi:hypothetical protein